MLSSVHSAEEDKVLVDNVVKLVEFFTRGKVARQEVRNRIASVTVLAAVSRDWMPWLLSARQSSACAQAACPASALCAVRIVLHSPEQKRPLLVGVVFYQLCSMH